MATTIAHSDCTTVDCAVAALQQLDAGATSAAERSAPSFIAQRSAISERLVSLMEAARKAEALHELETKRKPRRQTLSPSDVELLRNWSRVRPELPELIAAPDLTARIPVAGTRSCDAVRDPSHCCYRTNLTERLEAMTSWSRTRLPQRLPVLYLYSGVDLINAFGIYPDSPAFVLLAYHPAFSAGKMHDPFSEARSCLRSAQCAHNMVKSAILWYRHTLCLGLRTSMSAWMSGKHFPVYGVLPSLLLTTQLLDMSIVGAAVVASYHVDGIILNVTRNGGPVQQILYLSAVFSGDSAKPIFDEIERHVSLKPFTLLTKAALIEGTSLAQEATRALHAKWLGEQLRSRAELEAVVQDTSGLAAPLSAEMGLSLESGLSLYGECRGMRADFFKGGVRGKSEEDRKRRRKRIHDLPFTWAQMDPADEANPGCLAAYVKNGTT